MRGNSTHFGDIALLSGGNSKPKEMSRYGRAAVAAIDALADRCGQLSPTDEQAIHRARQTVR